MNNYFLKYGFTFFIFVFLFLFGFLSNASAYYYDSYKELKKNEQQNEDDEEVRNEDYEINYEDRGSDISVIAIHGGSIEPGTSQVAEGLANQLNLTYYLFEGIKSSNNRSLHIDSKYFDEPIGRNIAQNSVTTLSIHGYHREQGNEAVIYLGGRNETYKEMIRDSLEERGFQVEYPPYHLGGRNVNNITNDNQLNAGVQLELSVELRKSLFENHDWSRANRDNTTDVYDNLIDALAEATNNYQENLQNQ